MPKNGVLNANLGVLNAKIYFWNWPLEFVVKYLLINSQKFNYPKRACISCFQFKLFYQKAHNRLLFFLKHVKSPATFETMWSDQWKMLSNVITTQLANIERREKHNCVMWPDCGKLFAENLKAGQIGKKSGQIKHNLFLADLSLTRV